jgi:IS605 OrfB family transposase
VQVLTVRCKLAGSDEDRAAMAATIAAFAAACRFVARETPSSLVNETRLREAAYRSVRERYGLSANLAQQAISRVSANRKAAKASGGRVMGYRDGAVQYDERTFCLYGEVASLTLVGARRRVPLALSDYDRAQLARHAGQRRIRSAQLVMRRSRRTTSFFLNVQIEVACAEPVAPSDWIGGDMGRTDILHTSNGRHWRGNLRKAIRDRHHRVRRSLQAKASKGTRSTRRRCRRILHRLSGRERRFQAAENHAISRVIVQDAREMNGGLCLEDLSGIRARTNVPKRVRRDHSGWSFFQLRQFVAYKARIAGIPVAIMPPRYTSQSCSNCGCLGSRRGKVFACEACGHIADADRNAAGNLRLLGMSVTHPRGPHCPLPKGTVQGSLESPRL